MQAPYRKFKPRTHSGFVVNRTQVILNALLSRSQSYADCAISHSLTDQLNDVFLSGSKLRHLSKRFSGQLNHPAKEEIQNAVPEAPVTGGGAKKGVVSFTSFEGELSVVPSAATAVIT